jgi:hypothetical protein
VVWRQGSQTRTDEVVDLKKENPNLKQAVAELYLHNDWQKKSDWARCDVGRRLMCNASKYCPLSDWLKIPSYPFVEHSQRSRSAGTASIASVDPMNEAGMRDWTISIVHQVSTGTKYRVRFAFRWWRLHWNSAELMPRELAWYITDTRDHFIFESSIYRILKAHDLITNTQFMVMSAAERSQNPTHEVHEL